MNHISWQRWAATFAILLVLSFLADYFFLHLLFDPSKRALHRGDQITAPEEGGEPAPATTPSTSATPVPPAAAEPAAANADQDNFLETLRACHEEVSSQGITTPEALMNYLDRSIGKTSETIDIENYIFTLPDGSERRVHIIPADNTNSKDKRELRYFSVDAEGYPQRVELSAEQIKMPVDDLRKSLVAQGKMQEHQLKSTSHLRDGSFLNLEIHNSQVYEFQWRGTNPGDHTMSCRQRACVCK